MLRDLPQWMQTMPRDPIALVLARVTGGPDRTTRLYTGVYEAHLNFDLMLHIDAEVWS